MGSHFHERRANTAIVNSARYLSLLMLNFLAGGRVTEVFQPCRVKDQDEICHTSEKDSLSLVEFPRATVQGMYVPPHCLQRYTPRAKCQ
jgi:hypothetical protein